MADCGEVFELQYDSGMMLVRITHTRQPTIYSSDLIYSKLNLNEADSSSLKSMQKSSNLLILVICKEAFNDVVLPHQKCKHG